MTQNNSVMKRTPASMLQSFVTVSGISGVSMFISFFMNIAIAAVIGATSSKDAYDVASYLPTMILFLFGLDLFKGISVSLFSRLDVTKAEDPAKVFSTLVNIVAVAGLIAVLIAEIFAEPLIAMIGPGLDPQTAQLAVKLARFLIPTLALVAVTSLIGSILLAYHYYGLNEALVALPKLAMLIGVLFWGKTLDVWVLAIAMIAGLVAKLPVMIYFLRRCGLKYSFVLEFKSPVIKSAIVDAIPIGIGSAAILLSGAFMQATVSYGDAGTVACFNYSVMLCGTLTALVCRPAYSVLAPRISRSLEARDYEKSSRLLAKSMGLVVLVCLASSAFVWTQASVIVDLILGRGRFTPAAIEQTSQFLKIIVISVLAVGAKMLALAILFARRKTKTIMVYCLLTSALRAVLAIAGRNFWGVYASPIAYLAGTGFNGLLCVISAIYIVRLHQKMTNPVKICRWTAACLIAVLVPMLPYLCHPVDYKDPLLVKIVQLIIVFVTAALSFVLAAWASRLYTVQQTLKSLRKMVEKIGVLTGRARR